MGPLNRLEEYIEGFHRFSFNEFTRVYTALYPDYEDLENRIEFSLLINPDGIFSLRFGLFKLYDTKKVASVLGDSGYKISGLGGIMSFAEEFVPEMALGFDFGEKCPRIKLYLLRLLDNPDFSRDRLRRINDFCRINDIDSSNLNEEELENCYLLGIDFHPARKSDIKIYTRDERVDFSRIRKYLEDDCINSEYLKHFVGQFSDGALRDVTISKKYSVDHCGPQGLSVFFEVADTLNQVVEGLIGICVPERLGEFIEAIRALETDKPVKYGHIGLTFSGKTRESLCLYFSPSLEETRNEKDILSH